MLGDDKSHVFGSIIDGVFEGKIITAKDSYFVEKARHYFPNHSYVNDGFHSVIYKEKHVEDPHAEKRTGNFDYTFLVVNYLLECFSHNEYFIPDNLSYFSEN